MKISWGGGNMLHCTFPHCVGVLQAPGSCSPAGRLLLRSGTDPPCRPHDSWAPSAAGTDTEKTQVQRQVEVGLPPKVYFVCWEGKKACDGCARTCFSMAFLSSSRSCLEDLSCMSSERSWSIWSLLLSTRSVSISTLLLSSSSSNSMRFSLSW